VSLTGHAANTHSVRRWVDHSAAGMLGQLKNAISYPGTEPAIFWLVAKYFNWLHHHTLLTY
jgi:hypothetical protein